jgi:hypothetical protein
MSEHPWSHLRAAVDALAVAGNTVEAPGFHPTQGGWACEMSAPLNPEIAASLVATDSRLTFRDDELSCSHCWAVILGRDAVTRYQARLP